MIGIDPKTSKMAINLNKNIEHKVFKILKTFYKNFICNFHRKYLLLDNIIAKLAIEFLSFLLELLKLYIILAL